MSKIVRVGMLPRLIRISVSFSLMFTMQFAYAKDASGIWQHVDHAAWIEIDLNEGNAKVLRNDQYPDRVGREIAIDITADKSKKNLWHGQVFAQRLGEYKKAKIVLVKPDVLQFKVKVGFISRTLEWNRVEALPAAD